MIVTIPAAVASAAIRHALSNSRYEVGGAFLMDGLGHGVGGSRIRYVPGENIAEDPTSSIQLSAEWIFSLLSRGDGAELLAFFHSHPGGESKPSEHDMLAFPRHYVSQCYIFHGDLNNLTEYNEMTWNSVSIRGGLKAQVSY